MVILQAFPGERCISPSSRNVIHPQAETRGQGPSCKPQECGGLQHFHMVGHAAAGAEGHVEGNKLAFMQAADAGTAQARQINEDIVPFLRFDRTNSPVHVKPLYISVVHFFFFLYVTS